MAITVILLLSFSVCILFAAYFYDRGIKRGLRDGFQLGHEQADEWWSSTAKIIDELQERRP